MSATARGSDAPRLNVLLLEDSADDAELIALELKRGGLNPACRRVATIEEMKDALEEAHWDLVLSDYSMPDFPVSMALELIRERELDVPFVIVSATIGEEAAVRAMKAGAHDYVLKHRLGRLVPAVNRELRESAIRRERRGLEEQLRHAQKMESIGLLAGGVAHDFNNLLTGIVGNASLVLDILNPPEPARFMLQEVIRASERATHLTRQLLAYAGKGAFVLERIDLTALVREIADLIRSTAGGADLTLNLAGDVPEIEADAGQVRQMMMNLLLNASEAIGERPGKITLRTFGAQVRPGELLPGCVPRPPEPGRYACLQVADDGCGIGPDAMAQIFDPFFTTKFAGRGLGLAAVLGIVQRQRGAVQVQSLEGRGSTFTVFLPSSLDPETADGPALPPAQEETPLTGTGVILVVDDQEIVRHAARAALEHYGYTVFEACDGQDGVEAFLRLSDRVAGVLLDLTMPNMNGQQACERMRRIRPDVRVLVSSGFDECEARRRFRDHTRLAFIQKPYTAAELAAKMKAVLGRR